MRNKRFEGLTAEFRLAIHLQAMITLLAVSYNSNPYTASHSVSLVWVQPYRAPHTKVNVEHLWALRDDPQKEMTGKQKWAGLWEEQSLKGKGEKRGVKERKKKLPEAEPTPRLQGAHIVSHQVKAAPLCLDSCSPRY